MSRLFNRGFISLTVTQFFGAANDNILKAVLIYMVIDGPWQGKLGEGGQGIVSAGFTLPFILLSGYAGQFSDRNSKRYVSIVAKALEIPIAFVALLGFWWGNLWVTLSSLIALACQSAYFGPAKYGIIPELVETRDLSRANGTINMMTNLAVIIGTLAAGRIADLYSPLPVEGQPLADPVPWIPGVTMVVIAILGLVSVVFLPEVPPGDRSLKYDLNPIGAYVRAIREMFGKPMFMVMMAWGYFYFLAGLALLIIPEYTKVLKEFNVDRAEVSVLLGVLGVAIGGGSAVAGWLSGDLIRPRMIPWGAAGLSLFFLLLGLLPPWVPDMKPMFRILVSPIAAMVFGAGVSAGFYIIPLQALLQKLSPEDERGRLLGTANAISFSFLLLASLFYWAIRPWFSVDGGEHPQRIFLICGVLMALGSVGFVRSLHRHGFTLKQVV